LRRFVARQPVVEPRDTSSRLSGAQDVVLQEPMHLARRRPKQPRKPRLRPPDSNQPAQTPAGARGIDQAGPLIGDASRFNGEDPVTGRPVDPREVTAVDPQHGHPAHRRATLDLAAGHACVLEQPQVRASRRRINQSRPTSDTLMASELLLPASFRKTTSAVIPATARDHRRGRY
jgi:hypothetical protein